MGRCGHKDVRCLYLHGPAEISGGLWSGCECDDHRKNANALVCRDCGAWLSLGPSNDTGCFAEIEAARLLAAVYAGDDAPTMEWQTAIGCAAHDADNDPPGSLINTHPGLVELWHAGWLARLAHTTHHDNEAA